MLKHLSHLQMMEVVCGWQQILQDLWLFECASNLGYALTN